MSHMVIYRGSDGKPGYHQTDDIHDAVAFVERMRNDSGVEHARIFRLEEVVFEYKPYYRVELADGTTINSGGALSADEANGALPMDAAGDIGGGQSNNGANGVAVGTVAEEGSSAVAVVDDASDDGPKRGLFGR